MAEDLQDLFGEESLSYADFQKKLSESGRKLVDVSGGAYVAKGKYDKLNADFEKYKSENDVSKYADYENLKTEVETLRTEKQNFELQKITDEANVAEDFQKFVISEVKALVTDKKDFQTCLADYLTEHPQYLQNQSAIRLGSQVNLDKGQGNAQKNTNERMNEILRRGRK